MTSLLKGKNSIQRLTIYGLMTAFAMILGYVEMLIPLPVPVPGMKLGLANVATMVCFRLLGRRAAWIVSLMRIVLTGLLFGNLYSFVFSIAGGLFSLLFMTAAESTGKFSAVGVSMLGGVMHNVGQILAAALVLKAAIVLGYIPVLMAGGILCGIVIGLVANLITEKLEKAGGMHE